MFKKPSLFHTAARGQLERFLHQVTHHLQTCLYTELCRCGNGDVVGYHAVILAASSPLLKNVLEDSTRAGGPPDILMMDYTMEEVNNLLDLLYSGTAEHTNSLRDLVNIFLIEADIKVFNTEQEKKVDKKWMKEENNQFNQPGLLPCNGSDKGGYGKFTTKSSRLKKGLQKSKNSIMSLKTKLGKNKAFKVILCTTCGGTFANRTNLIEHNRKTHRTYKKRNLYVKSVCTQCGQDFSNSRHNKVNLKYHMKTQHGDISEILICKHCEKIFITKAQLNNHEVLHTDPTINCHQCGKLFHIQKNLKRHILSLHTDNSKLPVHCTVCSQGFIDSTILKDHMNVNLGLKPY